jgi:hypothetical protein
MPCKTGNLRAAARRLAALYMTAVQEGADIVLNACSSWGISPTRQSPV